MWLFLVCWLVGLVWFWRVVVLFLFFLSLLLFGVVFYIARWTFPNREQAGLNSKTIPVQN